MYRGTSCDFAIHFDVAPRSTVGGFVTGDTGSDIDISVVHPDAIGIQNPYEDLDYQSLPESP